MTIFANCGHDVTERRSYFVTVKTKVIDFELDRLVNAEETGVYCEACTRLLRDDDTYITEIQLTDEAGDPL